MDDMVQRAQRFINSYNVAGIPKVEEDGKTGWVNMYALTRILQFHLGISPLSDSFGPTTMATLTQRYPSIGKGFLIAGITRVIQSALYCKGYDGGEIDGVYDDRTAAGVTAMKKNMGVATAFPGDTVVPKVFKALLTMDAYTLYGDGTNAIRSIQQWLNGRYVNRRDFLIMPCDGSFSRDVQKNFMLAIQYEIGMSDDVANGVFGPGTKAGIKAHTVQSGSTGIWVQLYTAALVFNRRSGAVFTSTFDANAVTRSQQFQTFVKLPVTGKGDYQTWASLLVSTGDDTRIGTACDTSTELTSARLTALKAAGYTTVGRYLCNTDGSSFNKMIQTGELARAAAAGLRVFPIYQTYGNAAERFTYGDGVHAAYAAVQWARVHGFKAGTRIYFAVDFDALDYQVTDNVIPYFRGIASVMSEATTAYQTGIYAPRNACSRVAAEGLASASFVSDMSTGYSGNLGYPHPTNWAFDQISTRTIGSSTGSIQIDNDIMSGRDTGQASFTPQPLPPDLDVPCPTSLRDALLTNLRGYMGTLGYEESGSPDAASLLRKYTNAEAFAVVMQFDTVITDMARSLRIRKSYIQAPLFWEARHIMYPDDVTDQAVITFYDFENAGQPHPAGSQSDCSTGWPQIFAGTAIAARNYCIDRGILRAPKLVDDIHKDIWPVWSKLHDTSSDYAIRQIAYVLIHGASLVSVAAPSLYPDLNAVRATMARYNGTGAVADAYGTKLLGVYQAFEQTNVVARSS